MTSYMRGWLPLVGRGEGSEGSLLNQRREMGQLPQVSLRSQDNHKENGRCTPLENKSVMVLGDVHQHSGSQTGPWNKLHQHGLRTHYKGMFPGPAPGLLNQKLWCAAQPSVF